MGSGDFGTLSLNTPAIGLPTRTMHQHMQSTALNVFSLKWLVSMLDLASIVLALRQKKKQWVDRHP